MIILCTLGMKKEALALQDYEKIVELEPANKSALAEIEKLKNNKETAAKPKVIK